MPRLLDRGLGLMGEDVLQRPDLSEGHGLLPFFEYASGAI